MIKQIFDEIASESSTNKKLNILRKYKDNEILKKVLYLIESPRIKFYIKKVPLPMAPGIVTGPLTPWETIFKNLKEISDRLITGSDAKLVLSFYLSKCSKNDAYIIERIIEKKSKIDMGGTLINKVWPGLIEETPYMGAKPFSEKLAQAIIKEGAVSQKKMDGRYANIIIDNGDIRIESRQGEDSSLGSCKLLSDLIKNQKNNSFVLNGELTIDGIPRYESNGIIASIISIIKKGTGEKDVIKFNKEHGDFITLRNSIIFTTWDIINIDEYTKGYSNVLYEKRLKRLSDLIKANNFTNIKLIESKPIKTYKEAIDHFQECLSNGEEGTILKSLKGTWVDSKPNFQCKMKLEMEVEMIIEDFNYGTKGTKNEDVISALVVSSEDSKVNCKVPGITEKDMIYITNNMDKLLNTIITVKCNGLSKNSKGEYSLLHPRLHSFRDDKSIANTLEEIIEIENMKKSLS